MARIELINLNKSFGAVEAVKNLNFTIEDGEFVVFVGPSGCGKTTTLRMIAGFDDPTSGEIRIDGRVVNDLEPRDRNLGMVFQSHALFPHKNVAQNIEFGLRMKKVAPEERVRRVREVADMVRIGHLLDKMPAQCSGGESQRVALARTLDADGDPEAVLDRAERIGGGAVELDLAGGQRPGPELVLQPADREAASGAGNQEAPDPARPVEGSSRSRRDDELVGVRDRAEPLLARDPPGAAVRDRLDAVRTDVRAAVTLGQELSATLGAVVVRLEQRRQKALA